MHPVGRQRVQLPQPAPSPSAGRDDSGGRRKDLALARSHRAGLVVRRAVAERHVHEHNLSQAAPCGTSVSGAVDAISHHGAIRNPPDSAREGGVPRLAGLRPGAGQGVLVHHPAERGEASADPAVVCVTPARPRRIVDALRDDDVDLGHSGRS